MSLSLIVLPEYMEPPPRGYTITLFLLCTSYGQHAPIPKLIGPDRTVSDCKPRTSLRRKSSSVLSRHARASSGATMLGVPATKYSLKGNTSASEGSLAELGGSAALSSQDNFLARPVPLPLPLPFPLPPLSLPQALPPPPMPALVLPLSVPSEHRCRFLPRLTAATRPLASIGNGDDTLPENTRG